MLSIANIYIPPDIERRQNPDKLLIKLELDAIYFYMCIRKTALLIRKFFIEILEKVIGMQKGNLIIDQQNFLVSIGEKKIYLSLKEMRLLSLIAKHPGWVFTKEKIYECVYDKELPIEIDNSIYCLIHSLRKKIETNSHNSYYIKTVRGVGYKFVIPEE